MYPNNFITLPILNKINVLRLILKVKCMLINLPIQKINILVD